MINHINFYFDLLINLLTFFTYIKYFSYYFEINCTKMTYNRNYCIMVIFLILLSLLTMPYTWTLLLVFDFVFNIFTYESSLKESIFYIFKFHFLYNGSTLISYIILTLIFDSNTLLNNVFYQDLKKVIICIVFYVIFALIYSDTKAQQIHLKNPYKKYIYTLLILILLTLFVMVLYSINYNNSKSCFEILVQGSLGISIIMIVLILTIHNKIVVFLQRSAFEQMKMQQNSLNRNFYNDLSEKSKQLISLRHDFKNHIGVIRGRLEQGNYEEAMLYLNSISYYTQPAQEIIITNNQTISSILQAKKSECLRKEIIFHYEISFEQIYKITDMELIIILGNVLDNAISASRKDSTENRLIRLTIKQVDSYLSIVCANNFVKKPIEKNGRLVTIKYDQNSHGIGLNNVTEICQKYSGECKYTFDDATFTIRILLSNY